MIERPDLAFPTLASLVEILAESVSESIDSESFVTEMKVEMPVELKLNGSSAGLKLDASTPSQHVETSVLPVWHRLRLTIKADA